VVGDQGDGCLIRPYSPCKLSGDHDAGVAAAKNDEPMLLHTSTTIYRVRL
jgi:hypothetical protein